MTEKLNTVFYDDWNTITIIKLDRNQFQQLIKAKKEQIIEIISFDIENKRYNFIIDNLYLEN
jgi:hypothetical protein